MARTKIRLDRRKSVHPLWLMSTRAQLLERIEAFLAAHRMSARQFGLDAVNDHRLVQRLRRGAGVTLTVIEKAEAFMDARASNADGKAA